MSQPPPPPPPNQPPQGGFGAPQDPPPGGFGAPQAPPPGGFGAPQGPGYGYPQQAPPPGPPAQPGYGYPGQQPAPPPGPPYGYGYPQQQQPPTYPMQPQVPQGGGGGRKPNSQVVIIVAAVVAVALIIGGGVWYANSGKDDSKNNSSGTSGGTGGKGGSGGGGTTGSTGKEKVPANTTSKVLFQVPAPAVPAESSVSTVGSWLTDKVYAKSGDAEINGYDPDSGAKLWTIKLPGPVCTASRHTTDSGRTAIVYEPAMPTKAKPSHGCSEVSALDLAAGKLLWTKSVKSGDQKTSLNNVTTSANTVAVGSTNGGAAFDISTGKALWAPKPTDSCYDAGYGGGDKLVAVRKCGEYGSTRQLHIQTIDPTSGKVISEYKMSPGIEYASVVSTNPLVVAADVGDSAGDGSGISDFFSIDNKTGQLRTRISAPGKTYAAKCDGITRIEGCAKLAVGNDRLYIPTEQHDGGQSGRINEIVAFDLGTGKQTGQRADAGDGYDISPLRMDGGNLLAYKRPPYDKGGQIVSIDGTSFKETKLLENPATQAVRDAETSMLPDYAEILYSEGHLYMSAIYAHKPYSTSEKEYLAIAFGTQ
ncbi:MULTISPECIES: PQQ-binding-like beta-propeller repeat protein [Streptomyces]|uniref:PQQ-binding-like beta-propeller repeat protein n=1 Tax=Streptomyces mirabilis TaxID=68239 RepID=A0ABU3USF0_9ACTN|nr:MULTISPECIES: PQQ-binding-like beta-propeller repeat protein [Streptomyces]MCX4609581.1 PQQ-like beta-propeller repeat protein [Streptomyces mirabilis]MCX5349862.1 PQQ-like beta-propeller repeat protein [Streptomyces mirabilis]MDU8996758.1 PQQ-binding-like beta-propeller repeat protein [Streptomyces mirabilis]QDN88282.1 PQQ-binding-like beta-propeller repeat protein [Streptomyces sp. RLB3-6]